MPVRTLMTLVLCLALLAPGSDVRADVIDHSERAKARLDALRDRYGLAGLQTDARLLRAAAAHARDMRRNGFFAHQGSDGSSLSVRLRRQGYGFCFAAENIARGHETLAGVLRSWMESRGHRRNILNPKAAEFALVRVDGRLWVMVLGRPGC